MQWLAWIERDIRLIPTYRAYLLIPSSRKSNYYCYSSQPYLTTTVHQIFNY